VFGRWQKSSIGLEFAAADIAVLILDSTEWVHQCSISAWMRWRSNFDFTADRDETHIDDLDQDTDKICYLRRTSPPHGSRDRKMSFPIVVTPSDLSEKTDKIPWTDLWPPFN
jgi:hypothetical protein